MDKKMEYPFFVAKCCYFRNLLSPFLFDKTGKPLLLTTKK